MYWIFLWKLVLEYIQRILLEHSNDVKVFVFTFQINYILSWTIRMSSFNIIILSGKYNIIILKVMDRKLFRISYQYKNIYINNTSKLNATYKILF